MRESIDFCLVSNCNAEKSKFGLFLGNLFVNCTCFGAIEV